MKLDVLNCCAIGNKAKLYQSQAAASYQKDQQIDLAGFYPVGEEGEVSPQTVKLPPVLSVYSIFNEKNFAPDCHLWQCAPHSFSPKQKILDRTYTV